MTTSALTRRSSAVESGGRRLGLLHIVFWLYTYVDLACSTCISIDAFLPAQNDNRSCSLTIFVTHYNAEQAGHATPRTFLARSSLYSGTLKRPSLSPGRNIPSLQPATMFQTFSGNTRRRPNVNLSGRKTNPFGNPSTGAGSQAAVDRAQQDRAQRQRERDTLHAAKNIQRVWRGHACRQKVADRLRRSWDAAEDTEQAYSSEEEALAQLQLLLHFASARNDGDVRRIRQYGARRLETARTLSAVSSDAWPSAYTRLERVLLAILQRQAKASSLSWDRSRDIIELLRFVANQTPSETSRAAQPYYRTLADVVATLTPTLRDISSDAWELIYGTVTSPLKQVTGHTLNAYEVFGYTFLTLPLFSSDAPPPLVQKFRDSLADSINYKLLANALATLFRASGVQAQPELSSATSRLRLLGSFIYFHRYAHNFNTPEAYVVHKDFVSVVSMLLNSLPVNIIDGDHPISEVSDDDVDALSDSVTGFAREQLLSLVNQEGIGSLLAGLSQSSETSDDEKVEEARQLANYALALLRFFPRRGDEIRMWLYMGPSDTRAAKSTQKLPAIRYFWEASKRSSVFTTIFRDSRAAIVLLKPNKTAVELPPRPSPSGLAQHGFWQPADQETNRDAVIADEWRVILVFLELYTFVLKVTDDEEFFASAKSDAPSTQVRDSGLPLSDVGALTTFLKNIGFTLYFNAVDISSDEERAATTTELTYFNPRAVEISTQKQPTEPSLGGVTGLKTDYVKGLVTGLLRMIYERDSRRKFLPVDHWLMTSRFDMTSFIPAVVEEEESRHKIQEEDADDLDDEEEELDDTPQLIGTSRTQQQRRLESLQRQQRKASRRRYLQAVAPRLEVLQNMPFFIPFTTRVKIFREFVHLDMTKRRGSSDPEAWRWHMMQRPDANRQFEKHTAQIRREHEFDDAFERFYPLGQGLKEPIQITFMDQFGAQEAGIDGGGVTKEFLTSVTNRAFEPTESIDMFIENDQHLLYPNPTAVEELKAALRLAGFRENSTEFRMQITELLQRYEFLGRIIGKCLYEGILVDVNFAPFFLRKWALTGGAGSAPNESGYRPTLNDLRDLDEELYQGLHKLKTYTGDVEDFGLNFTVTDTVVVDHSMDPKTTKAVDKELKPDGTNTPVTNQNRLVYISYMARHRLQNQPYQQTTAFLRGLSTMVQPSWLSMFNHSELQTLVSGTRTSIDIEDLRRNTLYGGVYVIGDDGLEHPTVALFWKTMIEMSDGERRAVLKFVTSTPRAPLLGFGTLNPRFSIRDGGNDQQRLPSTSTCVNLLKLPMYKEENLLKEKLLYSVFSGAGFDLS
jgi:ubiquitin-protein ligase E3 C